MRVLSKQNEIHIIVAQNSLGSSFTAKIMYISESLFWYTKLVVSLCDEVDNLANLAIWKI